MKAMMSPQQLKQMLALGVVQKGSHKCCHRSGFSPEHVVQCSQPGLVICGGCGAGTCTEPLHVYCRFFSIRDGSPYERTGSKFYYRCEKCSNFLCTNCLGLANGYPCPESQLERYLFECPGCQGDVKIYRIDRVDMQEAVEQLLQHPSGMLPMNF